MRPVSVLLWTALFISWVLIPAIIIHYRLVVAPKRYAEIKRRLGRRPSEARESGTDAPMSAVWHYARLIDPQAEEKDSDRLLRQQFWYFHGWNRYAVPLVLVTVLSGVMLGFSGLWIQDRLSRAADNSPTPLTPIDTPFVMALWGAFVWSLYEIWSRRKSGDLTPVEVLDVALRFVVAIPIGYAFSLLVLDTVPSLAAFVASAFPLRDVRQLMRKQAIQRMGESRQSTSTLTSKGYLGEVLSGIGNDTIVRLEELNIETFLDLAYADPIRLMVKTGVPIQLVLAWIDQALLAVYAAPHKAEFDLLGMPCALDVREFYLSHWIDSETGNEKRNWRDDLAIKDLAARLAIPLEILPQLLRSICDDPHVGFLNAAWYAGEGLPTSQGRARE